MVAGKFRVVETDLVLLFEVLPHYFRVAQSGGQLCPTWHFAKRRRSEHRFDLRRRRLVAASVPRARSRLSLQSAAA